MFGITHIPLYIFEYRLIAILTTGVQAEPVAAGQLEVCSELTGLYKLSFDILWPIRKSTKSE
jgi:hypothetical protein